MTPDSAPAGWRRARYGDALAETDERAGDRTSLPVLSVTKTRGPMLASERFGKTMHGRDLSRYRVAPRNHIVADPMLLWDGSIGVQQVVDAGLVSPDYRVYKPTEVAHSAFMAYLVRSPLVQSYYQGGARGTNVRRNRIARSDFLSIPLSLPPLGEQRKIAAILSSVDDAIEATQAVVDQLQVVKKAMMAELLTRGLPGRHTRFKQTEIGEVPAEWEVVRLGELGRLGSGTTPSRRRPDYFTKTGGTPWVKTMDLTDGAVLSTDEQLTREGLQDSGMRTFASGTVLVAMYGGFQQIGRTGVLLEPSVTNQAICPIEVQSHLMVPWFLNLFLVAQRPRWRSIAASSRKDPNITKQDVAAFLVAVPALEEQAKIAAIVDAHDERLRLEQGNVHGLRALKSALMSVLLTGEVRVTPDAYAEAGA